MELTIKGYINPYARFNLQRLFDLVSIYAPSRMEEPVVHYLKPLLEKLCIDIRQDKEGNLFGERPGDADADTILLCSHMDTVFFPEIERTIFVEDGYLKLDQNKLPREPERAGVRPAVLGGDDRAGIEIILSVLEHYDGPLNLRVLFTTREEIGGEGVYDVDKSFLQDVRCGLVLDRRNTGDIVTRIEGLNLAPRSFIQHVHQAGKAVNIREMREVAGSFSDTYFLVRRNRIPCLNLSTAYFFPHTAKEMLDLYAFDSCIAWVLRILDTYKPSLVGNFHIPRVLS
ncbi:MAG: hypothetical protein FWE76_03580 [Symbiobacteriaceae bacterium]|nr:hypothetical protein [Symbiobacteriaceae bacterium]